MPAAIMKCKSNRFRKSQVNCSRKTSNECLEGPATKYQKPELSVIRFVSDMHCPDNRMKYEVLTNTAKLAANKRNLAHFAPQPATILNGCCCFL